VFLQLKRLIKKKDSISETKTLDSRYNKINFSYYLKTTLLYSLQKYADLFLKTIPSDDPNKISYVKILPEYHVVYQLLSPRALAFWIMDDGMEVKTGGMTLCRYNFTEKEVLKLKLILEQKFNLICTIHKKTNKARRGNRIYFWIYITKKSMSIINSLVKEFMHPCMI